MKLRIKSLITAGFIFTSTATWASTGFDCASHQCGLQGDGTYHNLVLGTVVRVGKGQDSEQVFRWARQKGWWKTLPDDPAGFAKNVHPVLIKTQTKNGSALVTGLMTDDEYSEAPIQVGDFVRYAPHDANHPHPKENTPAAWAYWKLVGCVQVICRAKDKSCMKQFKFGVYELKTGVPIDLKTGKPMPQELGIDPISYIAKTNLSK